MQVAVLQDDRQSQHRFAKRKHSLANLISFYDKVTCPVDEGKIPDVVFLDFSKVFDTVPHSILLDKLSKCEMNRYTVLWVKNWLKGRAQRIVHETTISLTYLSEKLRYHYNKESKTFICTIYFV